MWVSLRCHVPAGHTSQIVHRGGEFAEQGRTVASQVTAHGGPLSGSVHSTHSDKQGETGPVFSGGGSNFDGRARRNSRALFKVRKESRPEH
jgi:hypothetical protein